MYKKSLVLLFLALFACRKGEDLTLRPQPAPLHARIGAKPGIYDEQGRFVLLRGVNYNVLGDYWQANPNLPTTKEYDSDDLRLMASYGFNCVRLLFNWSALEPQPGVYDQDYIYRIRIAIEKAQEYGIYVLLDMHQDAWGKYIATPADTVCATYPNKGWDGAPLWATYTDGASTCTPNGSREKAPAVYHAWQNFWDNTNDIQGNCIRAWQELVRQTASYPNVVGYDLINEPSLGYKPVLEEIEKMDAYYADLIEAIRQAERETPTRPRIIFFENAIQWNAQDMVSPPNTGFTRDTNIIFAPHSYFESIQMNFTVEQGFSILRFGSSLYTSGLFVGEWGFFGDPASDTSKVKRFARQEDQYFAGSTWWQWAQAPGDPHGISWDGLSYDATSMHLLELDQHAQWTGNINTLYLDILSRTRPRAIAGDPIALVSNPDNGIMRLEANAATAGVTELWIPDRFGTPILSGTGIHLRELRSVAGGYIAEVDVEGEYVLEVGF